MAARTAVRFHERAGAADLSLSTIGWSFISVVLLALWCCLCGAVWIDVVEFPNQMLRIVETIIFMAWRKRAGLDCWLIALPAPREPESSRPTLRHPR